MGGLTFGAIGAALIAAAVSLIGLVLGKEQKTSEFRQEWINKLRDEISSYVTNVSAISDQLKFDFQNVNEKLKHLSPFYQAINSAANSIKLRLNPDEVEAQAILKIMDKIELASQDDDEFVPGRIQDLEDELISRSQTLLKSEWARVKAGETSFKVAKYSALGLTLTLAGTLMYLAADGTAMNIEPAKSNQSRINIEPEILRFPAPTSGDSPVPVPSATTNEPAGS